VLQGYISNTSGSATLSGASTIIGDQVAGSPTAQCPLPGGSSEPNVGDIANAVKHLIGTLIATALQDANQALDPISDPIQRTNIVLQGVADVAKAVADNSVGPVAEVVTDIDTGKGVLKAGVVVAEIVRNPKLVSQIAKEAVAIFKKPANLESSTADTGKLAGNVTKDGVPPGTNNQRISGQITKSDPVNVATGEAVTWHTDFVLPGSLPITFDRAYSSMLHAGLDDPIKEDSILGPNWCCNWGQCILDADGKVTYLPGDGRTIPFELTGTGWQRNPGVGKVKLRASSAGYEVRDEQQQVLSFSRRSGKKWLLTSIEDPNRNSIRFVYDDRGALKRVDHSGGYRLRIQATPERLLGVSLELASGALTQLVGFQYDGSGRLSGVVNGSGLTLHYEYDSAARMTRWVDRERSWFSYKYDEKGRCIETVGPDGMYQYRFEYAEAQKTVRVTDSYGGVSIFRHDDNLRIVSETDPLGGTTRTKWDERGNKLSEADQEKRLIRNKFDDENNLLWTADPLGKRTSFEYDNEGRAVAMTDAAGHRWIRRYDRSGNLIESGREGSAPWRYERDAGGNVMRVSDPEGRTRDFVYDSRGLPLSISDWAGNLTRYELDDFGRVILETDPIGRVTSFDYNALGKLSTVRTPDGNTLLWRYDAEGNLTQRIGKDGGTYRYDYGPLDFPVGFTRPSGHSLRLHRDLEGRVQSVENAAGERWSFGYDACGRVVEEVDFSGRRNRFEYDASGLCTKQWNGNGEATAIRRDRAGRITNRRSDDGEESVFEYDALGRVKSAAKGNVTVAFERDSEGRILRERQGDRTLESTYDVRGLRTKRQSSSGRSVEWSYDPNGRLSRLGLGQDEWLEFSRDAVGRETERRMRGGVVLRQEYDTLDRLTRQWAGVSAGVGRGILAVTDRQYRYDVNDDPIEINDRFWGSSSYSYDSDGRIMRVAKERGSSEAFSWDHDGNLQESSAGFARMETRLLGRGGRLEKVGSTQYFYDAAGRLLERREGGRVWRYTWSVEGHLKSVLTPGGEKWEYQYDAFGRRVSKSGPGGKTTYVWDGPVVAEEIREDANPRIEEWLFEPDTFRPLVKFGSKPDKTYLCVTDQAGTPRELVGTGGTAEWSARFTVWGEVEEERAQGTSCTLRFQGQWFDEESGLHYNFHRNYDPRTGQYLSPDPSGLNGGTQPYGYVQNPLSWVDPLGLVACQAAPPPNRRQAFNLAKDKAGVPRSQQPTDQWTVGNDPTRARTSNYRFSEDQGTHGRYYQYNTPQGPRVVVEHTADPNAPLPHFHAGEPKGNPADSNYDFRNERYGQVGGKHHIYYGK
jgi:RHS repeat-associated protein